MAVIDELVVVLGLDAKKFNANQREALDNFKKTQDAALRGAKDMEQHGKTVGDVFGVVKRQAVGLLAALFAGKGIKDFTTFITQLDANTGRLAKTMNLSTEELSTWQEMVKKVGGNIGDATASIAQLSTQVNLFALGRPSEEFLGLLSALRVDPYDSNRKLKSMNTLLFDLNRAVKDMDPAQARVMMQSLGLSPGMIQLMLLAPDALKKLSEEAIRLGITTKANADAAAKLEHEWENLEQRATSAGRRILNFFSPALVFVISLFGKLQDKIQEIALSVMPPWLKQFLIHFGFASPSELSRTAPPAAAPAAPAAPTAPGPQSLRVKPGAGIATTATSALAHSLQQQVPGLDRFTSFNDPYHAFLGRSSAHTTGRALDFTIKDPTQSAAVAAQVRAKLAEMGIDAKVIDEYMNPSRGSTGGHIHVQFNSALAAAKYSGLYGAPAAAAAANVNNRTSTNTSTATTTVGTVIVNTQATDATGIARDIVPALERNTMASRANTGPQ